MRRLDVESHRKGSADQEQDGREPARASKKPYRAPELIEYGSVAKLTQANAGSGADGGRSGTHMKF
jgi:hypothetical protein